MAKVKSKKAKVKRQKAEGRRQKAEGKRQKAKVKRQKMKGIRRGPVIRHGLEKWKIYTHETGGPACRQTGPGQIKDTQRHVYRIRQIANFKIINT